MMMEQRFHLQPVEDPTLEQVETPKGGCDPVGSPRWNKLLAGPVDPWREEPTPEQETIGSGKLLCVTEATEEDESSQFAEMKAIQVALEIAEREKWPVLYLYTDSWMVANALWGWLQQWRKINWPHRGKPIWAAALWRDIAARVENMAVKVRHVDAHMPKSSPTVEY
ncbi:hypothetical protein GRJ2_003202600 [Grus japonensis]|uniref:RNase H type-1 domain-containing protein n=1 Tax=Grus japonensis TaxID=30415 RepID=A0ABC9YBD9_GRUJA